MTLSAHIARRRMPALHHAAANPRRAQPPGFVEGEYLAAAVTVA